MSRTNEKVSIYDIITNATQAGDWVNGEFEAIVQNAVQGQGRKPSKCDMHDPDSPNLKIIGVWFGGDFVAISGSRILVSGQGIKAKEYRGAVEVTIGDKATVQVLDRGAAPASRAATPAPSAAVADRPPATRQAPAPVDAATATANFHKIMKKTALLLLHADQYAADIEAKRGKPFDPAARQAVVSSLFITAKDKGLLDLVPALRAVDAAGVIAPFIPPAKPADPDAEAKAAEAAKLAAAKAAEEARLKAEREKLDEDVPF